MSGDWRDRLLAYDEPHLDPSERAELERILDTVPGAREFLASLRRDKQLFCEAFSAVRARPGFVDGVMTRLPRARASRVPWPRLLEVCAAGLMMLVISSLIRPARDLEQHKQLVCQQEVRDLTRAVLSYAEDYDGRLPSARRWVAQLTGHRGEPLPLRCPSDDRPVEVSYGLPLGLSEASIAQLDAPSTRPLLFDANGPFLAPRHARGANIGFLDGRVEHLTEDRVNLVGWEYQGR